ncbi:MAG: hypothetical protein DRO23_09090 [Thermoprotei archaeon]|nr:MAG: hypothetical protein DRO23_09090 [Thermoprotei archaeon]
MQGLLGELLKPFLQSGITPTTQVTQKELVISINETELKKALLKGVDDRFKPYFDVQIREGELRIIVRLQ